jgi:hypothetical protein
MGSTIEIILTIIAMSFWILFPIGMFISVGKLDKNTDQVVRLDHLRHDSVELKNKPREQFHPVQFDWHHPILYFRRWLLHE